MNFLITGGAGFLGSHLVEELLKQHKVTIIDNLSTGKYENIKGLGRFRFHKMTLWEKDALSVLKKGRFDVVIHAAASAYIPHSVTNPLYDFRNNLDVTVNLLETVRCMSKRPKILLFSSAAVLGECKNIMKESDPVSPISPYGVSKAGVELYGRVYSSVYNMKIGVVRLFPLYGPRQRKQVVYDLMQKLLSKERKLEVIGTGKERRDLFFVKDAVRAITKFVIKGDFSGAVTNVCSGNSVSIRRIAETLMEVSNIKKDIRYTKKLRRGDASTMVGSTKVLNSFFDTGNITSLSRGIELTWKWFAANC